MIITDFFVVFLAFGIPQVIIRYLVKLKVRGLVRWAMIPIVGIAGLIPLLFLDRSGFIVKNFTILGLIYIIYIVQIWHWSFEKDKKLVLSKDNSGDMLDQGKIDIASNVVTNMPKLPITFSNSSWFLRTFFKWKTLAVGILGNIILFVVLASAGPQIARYSFIAAIPLLFVFMSFFVARVVTQEIVVNTDRIVFKKPKSFEILFSDLLGILEGSQNQKFTFLLKETAPVDQILKINRGIIGPRNGTYEELTEVFGPLQIKHIYINNSGLISFKNSPLTKAVQTTVVATRLEHFDLSFDSAFGKISLPLYTRNELKESISAALNQLDVRFRAFFLTR